jgi:hypothetical protein
LPGTIFAQLTVQPKLNGESGVQPIITSRRQEGNNGRKGDQFSKEAAGEGERADHRQHQ